MLVFCVYLKLKFSFISEKLHLKIDQIAESLDILKCEKQFKITNLQSNVIFILIFMYVIEILFVF